MRKIRKPLFLITCVLCFGLNMFNNAQARVRIKSLDVKEVDDNQTLVTIKSKGKIFSNPELSIRDNIVQVVVHNATVWPKIEKKVTFGDKKFDTTLMAYQYNRELVRVRAILPFSLEGKEDQVKLTVKRDKILFSMPRTIEKANANIAKQKRKTGTKYDENYLQQLLDGKEKVRKKDDVKVRDFLVESKDSKGNIKDVVKSTLSAAKKQVESNGKSKFSLGGYVIKFTLFLGVVLLLFYLIVGLLKKGVLKKGRLGFLNDTKLVSVLNTTYLAPKKSLIMVKVHKQVLLLGSDEKGLHFLSEIDDVNGLLKDGEKSIAGSNFDTSLTDADEKGKEFKLKEVVSTEQLASQSQVKDKVKLSDQIKNKVKSLRPLQ